MQKRWKWLDKAASSKNPDQKTNFYVGSKNGARSGIPPTILNSVVNTIKAIAIFEGNERDLFVRVARKNNRFYYDLSDKEYNIVEIDESGWRVKHDKEFLFQRFNHHKGQSFPIKGGGKLKDILKYINVSDDEGLLFVIYLISCFIPDIQHPILILHGESGNGKTTISRIVKDMIDPSKCDLMSLEDINDDFFLIMEQHWLLAFDNSKRLSEKRSNNLCQVVTGIAMAKRKLYKDKDTSIFEANRCLVINSIENAATKEDLLNRSIILHINRKINNNEMPFGELMRNFQKDKPFFLGKIFDILANAMEIYKTIQLKGSYRMAEFAKWGYAIGETLGNNGDTFLKEYKRNIDKQITEAISSNTCVNAISIFMSNQVKDVWIGRLNDLLREIEYVVSTECLDSHSATMPKAAPDLAKKLKAYKGLLEKAGVQYIHDGRDNLGVKIRLKKL